MTNKKAVSPVVATILLIAIVVVSAVLVFIWAVGFVGESITKKGTSADQVCQDISLAATYSSNDGKLFVENTGNIPVFSLEVQKKVVDGDISRNSVQQRIYVGASIEEVIGTGSYDWVRIYPAIYAEGSNGRVVYTCKNFLDASLS